MIRVWNKVTMMKWARAVNRSKTEEKTGFTKD